MTNALTTKDLESEAAAGGSAALAYVKNLLPKNEPVLVVSWLTGFILWVLSVLATHNEFWFKVEVSPLTAQIAPVVAGILVGVAGHFARPLVTPNSKVPKVIEGVVHSVLTTVEGVIDGSDGFPKPEDNSFALPPTAGVTASVTPTQPAGA